jgi:glycosyltransferase involved in cell wall biosynthesis
MTHLSVVIPVFNESLIIQELIRRIKINVKLITQDYEVLIVDDGSQDRTWELIENEAKKDKRIRGIKFSRNFGHHFAITAGIHNSTGEWVIVMDGDLQDRPEVIPDLYNKAQTGFDVVFVSRINRPESIYYRTLQRIFYKILQTLSGLNFDHRQANYSIINKKVVEAFKNFPEYARFYASTIKWLGFKSSFVLADHGTRYAGKPSYTIRKRFKLASDIILSFSDRPLRASIFLGIVMSTISLLLMAVLIWRTFYFGSPTNAWTSVIVILFFSTGIILIVIGISSIYIAEIFKQVKNRPLYIIDKKI